MANVVSKIVKQVLDLTNRDEIGWLMPSGNSSEFTTTFNMPDGSGERKISLDYTSLQLEVDNVPMYLTGLQTSFIIQAINGQLTRNEMTSQSQPAIKIAALLGL